VSTISLSVFLFLVFFKAVEPEAPALLFISPLLSVYLLLSSRGRQAQTL
jgi:hypothetical protein